MSDKVVGKIFVTSWKNYKKFRDNENNRNLDERHVAKLVASFRKNGWDIEPITVNKDYVIISGHHRLAGWESDACVLGTCFDLFDKGVPFRIVTDCIASERQNAHEAALVIMNRNFGKVTLIKSEEV